jgi:hypothetical protein
LLAALTRLLLSVLRRYRLVTLETLLHGTGVWWLRSGFTGTGRAVQLSALLSLRCSSGWRERSESWGYRRI